MKKLRRILFAALVAMVATGCSSAYYTAGGSAYDDLYASHNRTEIANRQKAEAEARRAEAEARKAEAEALQAEYEAKIAAFNAQAAAEGKQTIKTQVASSVDDLIIIEDNSAQNFVADSYESAYARRLKGFRSPSYRMPSSYFNLRYTGDVMLATAYDPAFYNIMVSGDQVWVEPRYITSMFGTWGATNATALIYSPWYYGWNTRWGIGWGAFDPWYYSSWGFPRYSWYDWNWNICYGGGWGVNLWWGWGGHYHPWRPHYHHHHHYSPWHDHWHMGPGNIAGGGGHWHGSLRGTRLDNGPAGNASHSQNLRKPSFVKQGSINSSPYRSPNNGSAYGSSTRRGSVSSAIIKQQQEQATSSRGQSSSLRSGSVTNRTSQSIGRGNTTSLRNNNTSLINNNRNNSQSTTTNRNNNSSSSNRSNSSYNSSSSISSGSSFSSGSSSRGGGGSYGGSSGSSRSGGSRGR